MAPTDFSCLDSTIYGFFFLLGGLSVGREAALLSASYLRDAFNAQNATARSVIRCGTRRTPLDEVQEGCLVFQQRVAITAARGVGHVVDDHAPDLHDPVLALEQVVAAFRGDDVRNAFAVRDGADFIFCQVAEPDRIFIRKHPRPPVSERRASHAKHTDRCTARA